MESHMFKAQLPCLHHSIVRLCWGLKGCDGILGGVSVNGAELLWLCCSLLCSCCDLCGCACVLSKVFHVTATASQNAPCTTQLVLCFGRLCAHCKQGMLCCSHSLPECNAYFQIFVFYSAHPQRHTQCSSELLSFIGAALSFLVRYCA